MSTIKDRDSKDLTKSEEIKKRWQKYTELYKKVLNDPDNQDGVFTLLEPDIPAGWIQVGLTEHYYEQS